MIEKKIVKTVRFKEEEMNTVQDFLKRNPGIDFSTLIRIAVSQFIASPSLKSLEKKKTDKSNSEEVLWN